MKIEELIPPGAFDEAWIETHGPEELERRIAIVAARAAFEKAADHCDRGGLDYTAEEFKKMAKELE